MKKRDKEVREMLEYANKKPENAQAMMNYSIGFAEGKRSGIKTGNRKGFTDGFWMGALLVGGYSIYKGIKRKKMDKKTEEDIKEEI